MNTASIEPIRHGDVILWPIDPVDTSKLAPVKRAPGADIVLTQGSATGHEHVLRGASIEAFDEGDGGRILVAREPAELVHAGAAPRHEPIALAAGTYRQSIKRQESPEGGWENVVD